MTGEQWTTPEPCALCKKLVYPFTHPGVPPSQKGVKATHPSGAGCYIHLRHPGVLDLLGGKYLKMVKAAIKADEEADQ